MASCTSADVSCSIIRRVATGSPPRKLFAPFVKVCVVVMKPVVLARQISNDAIKVGAKRTLHRVESGRAAQQTNEAIVRNVFRDG